MRGHDIHGHLAERHLAVDGRDTHGRDTHGRDTHGRDTHGRDTHGHDTHGRDTHGHDTHGHDTHGHREEPAVFIARQTAIGAAPLVPELRLHLASEVTPLWYATEEALACAGVPPPYWAFAWAGGQALARCVLDRPELVAGKRVLDLATGGGIVAIAAAVAGALHVTAADIDPFAAAATRLNAALNGVDLVVTTDDLTASSDPGRWDVVLAGDVCYERAMVDRVLPWLRAQAARRATVLVGDPGRAYCPTEGADEIARYLVPTSLDLEGRDARDTRVLRLR